jgi:Mn2+/Fe2+ NRAMP family transporter
MSAIEIEKTAPGQTAVLDSAHIGDIRGALGTIRHGDIAARTGWWARFKTLLAIVGPGLIVMVGDNDAGAFGTYTQAGQNYGTTLLWTLALLIPVLYVNQEMVLRLGAVTGVGHARLILERFGKFWGAFSVIDLFLLNALTIVTEFIGISLAFGYLGLPKELGVIAAAAIIIGAAGTGDFRRFERFSLFLVFGSLLLVPVFFWAHPPVGQLAHDFVVPQFPQGAKISDVMLLIIAIVGTTVAPWQLFFQQSYVIDKRITPRFMRYERADLWIGIGLVIVGAVAMMAFTTTAFAAMRSSAISRTPGRSRRGSRNMSAVCRACCLPSPCSTPASSARWPCHCPRLTRSAMFWRCAIPCTGSRQTPRGSMPSMADW